ncbi:hypothetical protein [Kribbella sp. CA-293567]|uniref:hypothetical protein n=1 Tax=Kribbella sp. CA-293567 TaxID=3002436 RepID=UPI0022DE1182|nr:hypothetical protein [Kribbella sp. CA-293567]WBQ08037.1 hypothetical protein OX958_14815 [Kribbella sp. CA-293567]
MTDWTTYVAQPWQTTALRLRGDASPISGQAAYDAVVAAAEPFRHGSRFRTLPDVRFLRAPGRVGVPGELLPGPTDTSLQEYLGRVGAEPFVLAVREPLMLGYPLWSQVRALIEPLWQLIGVPVAPVSCDLVVSGGLPWQQSTPGYHSLVWALDGQLTAQVDGETLTGEAGDLLSWPPGTAEISGSGCLWLRLLLPTDGKLAAEEVVRLLIANLERRRGTAAAPYLPLSEADQVMSPYQETAARMAELSHSPAIERSLRVQWAKRISAGALEPVPAPRRSDLVPGQRVRSVARVYRQPDDDKFLWAVNGHAFTVGGGDELLAELRDGEFAVRDDAYLPLVRRLHALRAVEVVTP